MRDDEHACNRHVEPPAHLRRQRLTDIGIGPSAYPSSLRPEPAGPSPSTGANISNVNRTGDKGHAELPIM